MNLSLIKLTYDSKGHRWVLWSLGGYMYEIENRSTGRKHKIDMYYAMDSLAEATETFDLMVGAQ